MQSTTIVQVQRSYSRRGHGPFFRQPSNSFALFHRLLLVHTETGAARCPLVCCKIVVRRTRRAWGIGSFGAGTSMRSSPWCGHAIATFFFFLIYICSPEMDAQASNADSSEQAADGNKHERRVWSRMWKRPRKEVNIQQSSGEL